MNKYLFQNENHFKIISKYTKHINLCNKIWWIVIVQFLSGTRGNSTTCMPSFHDWISRHFSFKVPVLNTYTQILLNQYILIIAYPTEIWYCVSINLIYCIWYFHRIMNESGWQKHKWYLKDQNYCLDAEQSWKYQAVTPKSRHLICMQPTFPLRK